MTFEELVDQAIAMLERRGRVTYRALKRQFQLDDDVLDDLTAEIIKAQRLPRSPCVPHTPTRPRTWPRKSAPSAVPGRRTQAGHGALCRSQKLRGVASRPRPGGGASTPRPGA